MIFSLFSSCHCFLYGLHPSLYVSQFSVIMWFYLQCLFTFASSILIMSSVFVYIVFITFHHFSHQCLSCPRCFLLCLSLFISCLIHFHHCAMAFLLLMFIDVHVFIKSQCSLLFELYYIFKLVYITNPPFKHVSHWKAWTGGWPRTLTYIKSYT